MSEMRTTRRRVMCRYRCPGRRTVHGCRALALALALLLGTGLALAAPVAPKARAFTSPEEATKAFVDALRAGDTNALLAILGPDARPLISSGDEVADWEQRDRFLKSYDEANRLVPDGDRAVALHVGKDDWPFPIPLVKSGSTWRYDTRAGREEILSRRVGQNELSTIQTCLAYVDAQREYYERNPQETSLLQYAQRISSSKGKRDGLYWDSATGEPSPLGPLVAEAQHAGYAVARSGGKPIPYHGYYYRILTAQGPAAPGGAYSYLARGQMIGGFALVAYPAQWGSSGVMTFIVNHEGVVYEKNLGAKTAEIAASMKTFNPDSTWKRA
jgi:Protein of unknown function (DUF2950)